MTSGNAPTNLERFNAAMKQINERLEDISRRTQTMARTGTANLSNAEFRELMRLHAELTAAAEALLEKFAKLSAE